jgi:hypothetical protein
MISFYEPVNRLIQGTIRKQKMKEYKIKLKFGVSVIE